MEADNPANRSFAPVHTDLMVCPQEVEAVPGMSELTESIRTYISPSDPKNGAENVAIIFAAVLSALSASDIQTERRDNRSQYFSYMYRSEGYRASARTPNTAKPSEAQGATTNQRHRRGSKGKRHARAAAQEACRRHTVFLQKLFKKQHSVARPSSLLLYDASVRPTNTMAEHGAPSNFTTSAIRDVLGQILDRENEHRSATRRVYEAYAQLGCCFVKLVAQDSEGTPPSPETKVFHQVGFAIMERAMEGWIRGAELSQSALIKRLERARKIFLLVRCFGQQFLGDDALTMRLVDRTTFKSFSVLLRSPVLSSGKEANDMMVSL